MRWLSLTLCAVFTALLCAGCGSNATAPDGGASQAISDRARDLHPVVPAADTQALVSGNTQFALGLYHRLPADANTFYSPFSLSEALAMTSAGARGDTATQLAAGLSFTLPDARLHAAFNALDLALVGTPATRAASPFTLNIANALWGQRDFGFQPSFLDTLKVNYGAGLRLLDFRTAAEAGRQTINQWVSDQTNAKIQDLLAPGSVNSLTRLVLTNAIYFLGHWTEPFDHNATSSAPFHTLAGGTVSVPLMHQTATLAYAAGDGWQAVQLPYAQSSCAMLLLVPDSGRFAQVDAAFDPARLASVRGALASRRVELALPRFQLTCSPAVTTLLGDMGVRDAFDAGLADFSGMDGRRDLHISAIVHKAFLKVDEDGTEAAAATGVVVGTTSIPAEPLRLTIDRPFILAIVDQTSGTVLFLGRVVNPSQ